MIKQGQAMQQQRDAVANGDETAATSTPVREYQPVIAKGRVGVASLSDICHVDLLFFVAVMSSGNQEKYAQSPLQSLAAALNRQTTQRSRNPDSSRSSSNSNQ